MATTQGGICRERCIELRKRGYSLRLIAQETGLSPTAVQYHVRGISVETALSVSQWKSNIREPILRPTQPLQPSKDLAYLIGVISGDGSLHALPRTCQLCISCDGHFPDLVAAYAGLIERVTGKIAHIYWRNNGAYVEVKAYSKYFPLMFNLPCGAKTENGFTVPDWIFENIEYVKLFVRGLIETDGGIYHTYHKKGWYWYCWFTAYNDVIMLAFMKAIELLGYTFIRQGVRARMSNTAEVKRLVGELNITKVREYVYA